MGHSHDHHEHHEHSYSHEGYEGCSHSKPGDDHHHHGHGHHHHHHHQVEMNSRHFYILQRVFWMTCIYLFVEIVGGVMSGSLALLADGFHMFADAGAIGISLFAAWFSHRPAPPQNTFGYQRFEIIAALFNALSLVAMGLFILFESYERFQSPVHIQANMMMVIATGGLIINIISAKLLHADHQDNLNLKGAYLHVLGDLLGSLGAIIAGGMIFFFGWRWADPAISCVIAALIMFSAIGLLKEAVNVLLEGCPSDLNVDEVRQQILQCEGVQDVHHLHIWNINLQRTVLTAHLEVLPSAFSGQTINAVQAMLKEQFDLKHVTLQLEMVPTSIEAS